MEFRRSFASARPAAEPAIRSGRPGAGAILDLINLMRTSPGDAPGGPEPAEITERITQTEGCCMALLVSPSEMRAPCQPGASAPGRPCRSMRNICERPQLESREGSLSTQSHSTAHSRVSWVPRLPSKSTPSPLRDPARKTGGAATWCGRGGGYSFDMRRVRLSAGRCPVSASQAWAGPGHRRQPSGTPETRRTPPRPILHVTCRNTLHRFSHAAQRLSAIRWAV